MHDISLKELKALTMAESLVEDDIMPTIKRKYVKADREHLVMTWAVGDTHSSIGLHMVPTSVEFIFLTLPLKLDRLATTSLCCEEIESCLVSFSSTFNSMRGISPTMLSMPRLTCCCSNSLVPSTLVKISTYCSFDLHYSMVISLALIRSLI